jgi:hypothetical protein
MRRSWVLLLLIFAGGEARAMVPSLPLPASGFLPWSYDSAQRRRATPYRWGDLLISISATRDSEDQITTRVTVEHPWRAMQGPRPRTLPGALTISAGPNPRDAEHGLLVGTLDRAGTSYVLWQAYTGGAHCCFHIQMIVPDGPQRGVLTLGTFDMEIMSRPPTDVDGDGTTDFVMRDDRFLYTFASFAGSLAPPRILNVRGGRVADVSAEPRYRPLFEEALTEAREMCLSRGEDRNGGCASWMAAAARLGRLEAAWPEMLPAYERGSDFIPTRCRVTPGPDGCPERQTIRDDFPTALRLFLARNGYLPAG